MATMRVMGAEICAEQLDKLGRVAVRQIVEAGTEVAVERMANATRMAGHVRTGDMIGSIRGTEYRETLHGGSQEVYPQDNDRFGIRNATKAYVINYGRGRRKRGSRMGDKFITRDEAATEEAVAEAMQQESDRLIDGI